MGYQMVKKVLR